MENITNSIFFRILYTLLFLPLIFTVIMILVMILGSSGLLGQAVFSSTEPAKSIFWLVIIATSLISSYRASLKFLGELKGAENIDTASIESIVSHNLIVAKHILVTAFGIFWIISLIYVFFEEINKANFNIFKEIFPLILSFLFCCFVVFLTWVVVRITVTAYTERTRKIFRLHKQDIVNSSNSEAIVVEEPKVVEVKNNYKNTKRYVMLVLISILIIPISILTSSNGHHTYMYWIIVLPLIFFIRQGFSK